MYTVTSAARISTGSFANDAVNAWAVPWNAPWMLAGMPISSLTIFTALTASPSEAFGARLKESVTTGNWPWWLTVIGADESFTSENALKGTWPPLGNAEVVATLPLNTALA